MVGLSRVACIRSILDAKSGVSKAGYGEALLYADIHASNLCFMKDLCNELKIRWIRILCEVSIL